ncbi:MAG: hypothetical protein V7K50_28255 [Nostoc sp.]|uniref:hypothetical protein n=1 Tax=Nostoc sp. TaxID=1180 RepID=UPI002FF62B67
MENTGAIAKQADRLRHRWNKFSELDAKGDNSLENVIELIDEWTADESGYDEQTYPQIETGLNQNRLSL